MRFSRASEIVNRVRRLSRHMKMSATVLITVVFRSLNRKVYSAHDSKESAIFVQGSITHPLWWRFECCKSVGILTLFYIRQTLHQLDRIDRFYEVAVEPCLLGSLSILILTPTRKSH